MNIIEVVFYVHGVSPDKRGEPHLSVYEAMHSGIAKAAGDQSLWPNEFDGAEWGWNYDGGVARSHKALADAQRIFGGQIIEKVNATFDPTLNPARLGMKKLRDLMFHGFGDMFFYVSAEGKWAVRYEVARKLKAHIDKRRGSRNSFVSLTLLGHSAGAVIAFDFLYYLFNDKKGDWAASVGSQGMSKYAAKQRQKAEADLQALKDMARAKKLRLRRFITFGAPISMLMFRNETLVERLAQDQPTLPERYGLKSEFQGHKLSPPAPRWINIWDKDDIIAWPVEPIMSSELVEDVVIDDTDSVSKVHMNYWTSKRCHTEIAKRW